MSDPPSQKTRKVLVRVGYDEGLSTEAAEMLNSLGMSEVADKVSVVWNKRLRTTAGRAYSAQAKIELNPRLQVLDDEKKELEIRQTFLHELAHVVAYSRHPKQRIQPHGPEWKKACSDLGIPGEERCHDLQLGQRATMRKNYAYICPVCEEVIYRVKRMKRSVACFECCKKYNKGKYDPQFKLIEKRLV